jgi:hypothetical protein
MNVNTLRMKKILIFEIVILGLIVFMGIPNIEGTAINTESSWTMEGYLNCDFNGNEFYSGFRGLSPNKWEATEPVQLQYDFGYQDETIGRKAFYSLSFNVKLFDSELNLKFQDHKIITRGLNDGSEFVDSFTQDTSWNLSSYTTGISKGESWKGYVYLNATAGFGSTYISESSTGQNITYHFPGASLLDFSPEDYVAIILFTLGILVILRTRRD